MDNFELKDSGEREQYKTGAVRDTARDKPRPDLISPHANMREGMIMTKGAEKYAERNWEQGIPISRCIASACRHIEQYKLGQTDEDHLAQARTNLSFAIHFEEEIKAGRMDPAIDDMPCYEQRVAADGGPDWVTLAFKPPGLATAIKSWAERVVAETPNNDCILCNTPEEFEAIQAEAETEDTAVEPDDTSPPPQGCLLGKSCMTGQEWEAAFEEECDQERIPDDTSRPTFYITGPMRGYTDFNFSMFDNAAKCCKEAWNWRVISPAQLDRAADIDPATFNETPEAIKQIIERDLQAILHLNPTRRDGMVLLPDWEKSTGARAEVALALWMGIDQFMEYIPARTEYLHFLNDVSYYDVRDRLFYQDLETN